jgi:protein O-GlcNAc transferase
MQQYMLVPQQGSEPADEWVKLGVEAQMSNRLPDADRHYRQALRIDPRHVIATHNHAILFATQGNLNEALLTMERAMIFDDSYGALYMNYALMCLEAGRIDAALDAGQRSIDLGKKDPGVVGKVMPLIVMAMVLGSAGRSTEGIALYNQALDEDPKNVQAAMNSCFAQTLSFCGPDDLLAQRKRYIECAKVGGTFRRPKVDHEWPRPLRVGYVGGDFKQHSAAMIFSNVLFNHNREKVTPYYYCSLPVNADADAYTKKFVGLAEDRWRDISGKTDDEAAEMVRDDHIDILVDLAAHTSGGRLPIFMRKPAPLQITAWGFAHGTGIREIDYFFADQVAVPQHERQFYAEKIYDLPSLVTYQPPEYKFKDSSTLPYALNGFITFGSSARYEKISEECLGVFARILERVPDAVLRLKDSAYGRPYSIRRVLRIMEGHGVDPKRIHFLSGTSHEEHLQAYRNSDLQLDPFPHGGGVVALEQLYMGLPIITLYGTQPSGRNTASVLTAIGRADWVAKTPEEYVEKAAALADDLKALREARKTLRNELMESPVVKGYAAAVEAAYQEIWQREVLK